MCKSPEAFSFPCCIVCPGLLRLLPDMVREKRRRQKCGLQAQCPGQHLLAVSSGRAPDPEAPSLSLLFLPFMILFQDSLSSEKTRSCTHADPPYNQDGKQSWLGLLASTFLILKTGTQLSKLHLKIVDYAAILATWNLSLHLTSLSLLQASERRVLSHPLLELGSPSQPPATSFP